MRPSLCLAPSDATVTPEEMQQKVEKVFLTESQIQNMTPKQKEVIARAYGNKS